MQDLKELTREIFEAQNCYQEKVDDFLKLVAPNGEITFNPKTRVFIVWDETYAWDVCTTPYPLVAVAALKSYVEEYLGEG